MVKGDKILQVSGNDRIFCDYPEQFKTEFRNVPLADAEIRIAAEAKFEVSSSKIVDKEKETFSQRLEREQKEEKEAEEQAESVRLAADESHQKEVNAAIKE